MIRMSIPHAETTNSDPSFEGRSDSKSWTFATGVGLGRSRRSPSVIALRASVVLAVEGAPFAIGLSDVRRLVVVSPTPVHVDFDVAGGAPTADQRGFARLLVPASKAREADLSGRSSPARRQVVAPARLTGRPVHVADLLACRDCFELIEGRPNERREFFVIRFADPGFEGDLKHRDPGLCGQARCWVGYAALAQRLGQRGRQ